MSHPAQHIIIENVRLLGEKSLSRLIVTDGRIASRQTQAGAEPVQHRAEDHPALRRKHDPAPIVLDGEGCIAVPGMIDLYARLREPGFTRKGTIAGESRAALSAGFTRVLCAPDTSPAIDTVATVELIHHLAASGQGAQVVPIAALTVGLKGEQLSELATLQRAGCAMAGQADFPLDSSNVLYSAMEYAASFNLPLILTPRDAQIGAGGCAHTGAVATRLGLPAIPVAAETVALARMLELCRETGCRLHVSRLSSARAVDMIEAAKQQALPVTCDVGLHHLFFTEEHLAGYDSLFHSAVPFRSCSDRDALRNGVTSGIIDAICSDHAPHDQDAGLAPFPATEPGLAAYQWAMPLILQLPAVLQLSLAQVFDRLTESPSRILDGSSHTGLSIDNAADFFLLSTDQRIEQELKVQDLAGRNHPLNVHPAESLGLEELCGKVTLVCTRGQVHRLA